MNMLNIGLSKYIPDEMFVKRRYKQVFKKPLNLESPITFNEKLNWLKINDRKKIYCRLVDKYEVKHEVASIIDNSCIIPTIGVYNNFSQIDFEILPDSFVIKCTHDSGSTIICKNKSSLDFIKMRNVINASLSRNFYYVNREWPYKKIFPRIIVEEYLKNNFNDLYDYKFFVFNGVAKCFKVDYERQTNHHANYYDMECNLLPFGEVYCPPDPSKKIVISQNYIKMKEYAEKIARHYCMPFARVDFYDVNDNVFFGEITLYPFGGFGKFIPEEWDIILGDWLKLSINY